ncbi:MAG4940 family membrane protein [Mycoplasma elephantis]|uniref:MAG4940 family membrane protein n=1 Tax=Mycoplasma elephantis TaxID=114882 RepID=UPI0004890306|nr:hypothetical protein [Mycoplasma elephantis]
MYKLNTPGEALRTFWNESVFIFECLSVFILIFCVFIWMFIAKLSNKQNNKLYLSTGYLFSTSLSFFIPWGISKIWSKLPVYPMLNPIIVIFNSFIRGFGKSGQTKGMQGLIGQPILNGMSYIFFAQLLGGLIAFLLFISIFLLIKKIYMNHKKYCYILYKMNILSFFEKENKLRIFSFSVKEFIFILLFTSTVPFIAMIDKANYDINDFEIKLIELLCIFFIIYISSFFNFFAFHLFFSFIYFVINTICYLKNKRHNLLNSFYEFIIVLILTIIIPIIIAFIAIGIKIQSGAYLSIA